MNKGFYFQGKLEDNELNEVKKYKDRNVELSIREIGDKPEVINDKPHTKEVKDLSNMNTNEAMKVLFNDLFGNKK